MTAAVGQGSTGAAAAEVEHAKDLHGVDLAVDSAATADNGGHRLSDRGDLGIADLLPVVDPVAVEEGQNEKIVDSVRGSDSVSNLLGGESVDGVVVDAAAEDPKNPAPFSTKNAPADSPKSAEVFSTKDRPVFRLIDGAGFSTKNSPEIVSQLSLINSEIRAWKRLKDGRPPVPDLHVVNPSGKRKIGRKLRTGYEILRRAFCVECSGEKRLTAGYISATQMIELEHETYETKIGVIKNILRKRQQSIDARLQHLRCADCESGGQARGPRALEAS